MSLKMIGQKINIGVAKIGNIVKRTMAKNKSLTFPFRLHRNSRNQVDSYCLILQNNTCIDPTIHIDCYLFQKVTYSYFFSLLIQILEGFFGEDYIVVIFLFLTLIKSIRIIWLTCSPLLHREIVN